MEEDLIEELKHMKLTKEEETQIAISGEGRRELIEECELSLVGRLLSDRKQNQRALKSTLRSAWKTGSDLRIVDVGNDTFQFKFSSEYQMRWVENNGPWNFENNLLLLKRWEKGMTAHNISFTHSPFWLQIWGLPFDMMSEKIGRDIGNSIGNFVAADSKSWSSDQAKFMRIRVNIPLDRPLRRCGVVASPEGEKFQVYFRYERLPVFCFLCGVMGHDVRHCPCLERQTEELPQYGDWLRAQGGNKIGSQKKDQAKTSAMGQNAPPEIAGKGDQDAERRSLETSGNPEKQKVSRNSASMSDTDSELSNSLFQIQIQNSQTREVETERVGLEKEKASKVMSGPKGSIDQKGSMSSNIWEPSLGQEHSISAENEEVTSPIKTQKDPVGEQSDNNEIEKAQNRKGRWKKLARGQQTSNGIIMDVNDNTVGIKRSLWAEEEDEEGRQKKARTGESVSLNLTAVSAR